MFSFHYTSDSKASEVGKTKMSSQKPEGIAAQSSQIGATEVNVPLNVTPLKAIPYSRPIPIEIGGSGNDQAASSEPDKETMTGHKVTDSSLVGRKRGLDILAKDVHLWLRSKGFKIHKIGRPFLNTGDKERDSEGDEG